jgi:hypothetical protein
MPRHPAMTQTHVGMTCSTSMTYELCIWACGIDTVTMIQQLMLTSISFTCPDALDAHLRGDNEAMLDTQHTFIK